MEEKKPIKISLSTFFLILAIIVIAVMGYFIYKLYTDKIAETNKAEELQIEVNDLNEKIDSIANIVENTTINNSDNNSINSNFTEEQVKTTLADYLELLSSANCGDSLDTLMKKGKINYDSSKNTVSNDGTVTTSVKFSDYKKAMLDYVTEAEFERNWTSKIYIRENSNGYLTTMQGGGGLRRYTINSITKTGDLTYSAKTTSVVEDDQSTKENEEFAFTVKNYNGNCVIDNIKSNKNILI